MYIFYVIIPILIHMFGIQIIKYWIKYLNIDYESTGINFIHVYNVLTVNNCLLILLHYRCTAYMLILTHLFHIVYYYVMLLLSDRIGYVYLDFIYSCIYAIKHCKWRDANYFLYYLPIFMFTLPSWWIKDYKIIYYIIIATIDNNAVTLNLQIETLLLYVL